MTDKTIKRIHVTTLGCSKNTYDSEVLIGQLEAHTAKIVEEPEKADIIIVNTCGFIEMAKQESVEAILEAEALKKADPSRKVVICGCLSERYREELQQEMPLIDGFFGTEDYANILKFLDYSPELSPEYLYERRTLTTPSHYAYIKIGEGCNHTCSFCAIPLMRGRYRSREIDHIVAEAKQLATAGVKELIVISQDTTFYGIDRYGKQKICDLLEALEEVEGIEWIRLHYLYPTTVQDSLIELMGRSSKIVPYLDMPVQHVTDSMLKIMKRGGRASRIWDIFDKARRIVQDVTLRTTFIVGHPGETEADFEALKTFIQEFRFDRVGVFQYSHEENTSAHGMEDLPEELKLSRYNEIMEIQQQISLDKNLQKVGNSYRILVDNVDWSAMTAYGRTTGDSPEIDNEVIIEELGRPLKKGEIVDVVVHDASEYELYAKLGTV